MAQFNGLEEVDLGPIEFAAIPLSEDESYHVESAEYREAVEAVTAARIRNDLHDRKIHLGVVSWHRRNGYCDLQKIHEESDRVSRLLVSWIAVEFSELLGPSNQPVAVV